MVSGKKVFWDENNTLRITESEIALRLVKAKICAQKHLFFRQRPQHQTHPPSSNQSQYHIALDRRLRQPQRLVHLARFLLSLKR